MLGSVELGRCTAGGTNRVDTDALGVTAYRVSQHRHVRPPRSDVRVRILAIWLAVLAGSTSRRPRKLLIPHGVGR